MMKTEKQQKRHSTSELKIGAVLSYVSIAFNIVAGLLYTPWMVEQIGQSDYGLHTLATSLITLFLVDFGLGAATSRFLAKYRSENNTLGARRFLGAVYKLYLLIDGVIFVILLVIYCLIDVIYGNLTPEELEKFKVVYCIAALYSLISFPCANFQGILTAHERFIPLKLSTLISRIGTIVFTIIALLLGMGLYALVTVNAVWGLISLVIQYIYVRKCTEVSFERNSKEEYKEIFAFSLWSTVSSIASRLVFNITPTIIGITVSAASSAIAVFGIVSTIEGYVYTITTAINGMFLSQITRILHHDEDGTQLTELSVKLGRYQFALNSLLVLGFFLIGKEFILLWMGEDYIEAYYGILLVILPGLLYNSLQVPITTLTAMNLVKYQALAQVATGVCNIILSFVFSYYFGMIGAALSIFIAYILRIVLILPVIYKKTNVDLKIFVKECYLKMALPLGLATAVCLFLGRYLTVNSWMTLCLKGVMVVIVYALAVLFLGLKSDERRSLARKFFRSAR